ncbi:hypothetical protein B0T17DRAFT_499024 [Bombardia bombarda]|uniref:Uncharacterized protein n=1 Tax=Bombardia bombarda TaxID=252184 RepID=A0AA39WCM3_9PEZI|nr:hypothetical protein B0T17DRAFT_499024 [Bombardia bombarda]
MADEPTLPRLTRPRARQPAVPAFFATAEGRKRARSPDGHHPPSGSTTSSDPAVFSSDDDPALDNYHVHGRRKKRYVGTWFDQHPASSDSADSAMGDDMRPSQPLPKPQKRQFRRQLDSGVWMGLDGGSVTDTDDGIEMAPPPAPRISLPAAPHPLFSVEEEMARGIVLECLDNGYEVIDLSQKGLCSLSNAILEPLSGLTPIPMVNKDVAFEQRPPSLRLYLSRNSLVQFPAAIANLENLTVLSLRGNKLRELPPSIAALKNLRDLNVAQNRLRYLPGQLLELMAKGSALGELRLHPNPFFQPKKRSYCRWGAPEYDQHMSDPEADVEKSWSGVTTIIRSRTPVQFSDSARNILSEFQIPVSDTPLSSSPQELEQEDFWQLAVPKAVLAGQSQSEPQPQPQPQQEESEGTTRRRSPRGVPSLFEIALRAAVRAPQAEQLSSMLDGDDIASHLAGVVDRAVHLHQMGGLRCSVCGRQTLNPVTEWLEFREVQRTVVKVIARDAMRTEVEKSTKTASNSNESWVPFMRWGCSWNCLPHKAVEPAGLEDRARLLLMP